MHMLSSFTEAISYASLVTIFAFWFSAVYCFVFYHSVSSFDFFFVFVSFFFHSLYILHQTSDFLFFVA